MHMAAQQNVRMELVNRPLDAVAAREDFCEHLHLGARGMDVGDLDFFLCLLNVLEALFQEVVDFLFAQLGQPYVCAAAAKESNVLVLD